MILCKTYVFYKTRLNLTIFDSQIVYTKYKYLIQRVAAATINFSLAWVRLLIKGSSYSRAAFINFGPILDGVIHTNCSTEG